ncbi:HEPN domain-containing protein [Bifidobacterium favimelis]|uniref:HEPN domain-containing protein n=1 Tax=Bifidobacterium favimelis TaxID=3122979 RepID=A0ABU8ZM85_9BIFI
MQNASFPKFQRAKIIRKSVSGFNDPDVKKLIHTSMAPMFRAEKEQRTVEQAELIDSYLNALEAVRDVALKCAEQEDVVERMFKSKSLTAMPLLFLSRHVVELTLKSTLTSQGRNPKKIHMLQKLWKSAEPVCRRKLPEDQISEISDFIGFFNGLDPHGTRFRYSTRAEDGSVDALNDAILWLDPTLLVSYVESLVTVFRQAGLIPENQIEKYKATRLNAHYVELTTKEESESGEFLPYDVERFTTKQSL